MILNYLEVGHYCKENITITLEKSNYKVSKSMAETTLSTEEEDNIVQSTKRRKNNNVDSVEDEGSQTPNHRLSYSETVCGQSSTSAMATEDPNYNDDDASDDDIVEDLGDVSCFSMGMTKQEMIAARRPWRTSLILKLVGRRIGY